MASVCPLYKRGIQPAPKEPGSESNIVKQNFTLKVRENEPDDAASALIKDRNGVTLACVFARKSANVTKIHGEFIHSPILVLRDERSHNSLGYPGTKRSMTSSSASQFVQKYPDIPEASLWWVQGIPNCFDRALRHKGIDVKFTDYTQSTLRQVRARIRTKSWRPRRSKVRTKVSIGQSHDPPLELDLVGMVTVASYTRTSSCAKIINILNRGQAGDCRSNVASMGNTVGGQLNSGWNLQLESTWLQPETRNCNYGSTGNLA
ncbi:hypothetical protein B0H13DRAFT_1862150 [Mycena leptocephala]|nr:hypothetical protein B0H13DRAFT_1862150 [Mycena leptocephala]